MAHKLLVIDDNQSSRDMYKYRFEIGHWQVETAFSAEDALDILKTDYSPDAILLDVMLPKMQGDELIRILRNTPKTKDTVIIVLTAASFIPDDDKQVKELKKLSDQYLLKIDVTPKELVECAESLLEVKFVKK
jgi:DNA-binding response OmpR family regulator